MNRILDITIVQEDLSHSSEANVIIALGLGQEARLGLARP